jgi:hypothetical protein
VSALDLAARLATITGNLRSAIDAPAENLADRIKPEIDKLDACATQQDEFAGKLPGLPRWYAACVHPT